MVKDVNKPENTTERVNLENQKVFLTAKEARSEIAKVFLDKRKEINEEIEKIQQDETITDKEKKVKIDKLNKELYDYVDNITRGYNIDRRKEVSELQRRYGQSYIKRFQIKELEREIKGGKYFYSHHKKSDEEKLSKLKDFYENTKYIGTEGDTFDVCDKLEEELKGRNEWIDWEARWKKDGLFDGKTFDEICNLMRKNGLVVDDAFSFDKHFYKKLSKTKRQIFIDAVVDGGGVKVPTLSDIVTEPYLLERLGGVKENDYYQFHIDNYESLMRLEKFLEVIQKTGGMKEGCFIWIDFHDGIGRGGGKRSRLEGELIHDAKEKGINSTIEVRHNRYHEKNIFEDYSVGTINEAHHSGYGSDSAVGMMEIEKEKKRIKDQRKKNQQIKNEPVLKPDNYQGLEVTDENIQKVIATEGKKIKDSIANDYSEFKKVGMEKNVSALIDYFIKAIEKKIKGGKDVTLQMVGSIILTIGDKILGIYKHPYHLNGKPKDPDLLFEEISISEKGLEVKIKYTSGVSGTWVGNVKVDDPNFEVETYLTSKDGGTTITHRSYNMRDLYK